jgi:CBS domain-containing protein
MAITVEEIMNGELFSVGVDEHADAAASFILALNISGAPVLGGDGCPVGVVSLRDLVREGAGDSVKECMSTPVITVERGETIEEAGKMLAEAGVHRLIVVDDDGRAVGNVSALDVVRGLLGIPARHPEPFPHYDAATGLTWSDDHVLSMDDIEAAPDGPGVLVLIAGGRGVPERMVWAEASANVRTRLIDIMSLPQDQALSRVLDWKDLRFRSASVDNAQEQRRVLDRLGELSSSLIRFFAGDTHAGSSTSSK